MEKNSSVSGRCRLCSVFLVNFEFVCKKCFEHIREIEYFLDKKEDEFVNDNFLFSIRKR